MSSEIPWTPDDENDDEEDDIWFETGLDEQEMDEHEFYESRDGYYLRDEALHLDTQERTINAILRGDKKFDYEALRPYFAWKPIEVVKETITATTQFGKNVLRLPMRRHFKSRFPALRVRRINEVVATDTFFANEKAHDGSTMAQLYVGKTSYLTDIFGMRSESEMPGSLQNFIHMWGAMDGYSVIMRLYKRARPFTTPYDSMAYATCSPSQTCSTKTRLRDGYKKLNL